MINNVNKLNKLVLAFFEENADAENWEELWMDKSNQKKIKSIVSSTKATGRKKDPNAPKRGKSAYLFFCHDNRTIVKADLGEDSKATEVTAELGRRWNLLKESKKAKDKKALASYNKQAAEAKATYEAAKADYVPPETDDESPRQRGKSKASGPKRPKSAYLFFCADHRATVKAEGPDLKATEVTAELGRLWNELKADEDRADELAKYEKQAADAKAEYADAKAALESPAKAKKSAPAKTKKATPTKAKKSAPTKAKKPAPTKASTKAGGYHLFCAERRAELKEQFPKAKANEITKKLSVAWKALSKEEKQQWKTSNA